MIAPKRIVIALVAIVATAAIVTVGVLASNTSGHPTAGPTSTPTITRSSAPATSPPAPRVGSCHRLTVRTATAPTDPSAPVPCTSTHTTITLYVGQTAQLVDGHLLGIDSTAVQQQLARQCPRRLPAYVGGSLTTRRLSQLQVVWFGPTVAQADRGAGWFRCDLVALAGNGRLATLPPRMRGVLNQPNALARFGTCGSTAPGTPGFQRVICSGPHRWHAVDIIGLPRSASFLGSAAGSAANAACKNVATNHANGALKYTWSFEWPTKTQWAAGQRYGYCWLPGA